MLLAAFVAIALTTHPLCGNPIDGSMVENGSDIQLYSLKSTLEFCQSF